METVALYLRVPADLKREVEAYAQKRLVTTNHGARELLEAGLRAIAISNKHVPKERESAR